MAKGAVLVIGSGFSGLAAATCLADRGFSVKIVEKNHIPGGRARRFTVAGFTFDMGPSWYWMPDIFESYFQRFHKKVSDYYTLERLDPSYQVIYSKENKVSIPARTEALESLFDSFEKGAGEQLRKFLKQAAYKYTVGVNDLVYKPGRSLLEFANPKLLYDIIRLDIFQSMSKHVRKFFTHPQLIRLVEFPVLFLGALPENTPALYSLMNYADMALGTWYPQGGMYKVVEGMASLAREKGVEILTDHEVLKINADNGRIRSVHTHRGEFGADIVVASADYHHVESQLLDAGHRNYSEKYWDKRIMAPSSLIYYLGVNKKLTGLLHHNLFFDVDFTSHAQAIYKDPKWPENPMFYVSVTSKTDALVAPEGCENVFILIPVAPGLEDSEAVRTHYFDLVMNRLEELTGQKIKDSIIYQRSFAHKDFIRDYHAYKGNAYGLANTLRQTAFLKPGLKSKKLKNLYYTGQLTVPGPGVPPSLVSGQVVADEVVKDLI